MVSKSLNYNAVISLNGYRSYLFEKEGCELFVNGDFIPNDEKQSEEEWMQSLVGQMELEGAHLMTFLASQLIKISGLFSLIIKKGNNYYLAVDRIRSLPLFYGFRDGQLFLTSNLHEFQEQYGSLPLDRNRVEEFITASAVLGNGTIYQEVYGLQPGELVSIRGEQVIAQRYFEFRPNEEPEVYEKPEEFYKEYDRVLLSVFKKMLEQTPNVNRWFVSLSGGHDSRIIANYLFKLGVKNVVCYTYGTPNNSQSIISKQVADALGYEWHFVEYTEQKWQALHEKGLIDQYIDYAFNGVCTTHLQDFLAVYELKEKEIVQKGDVFVSGHTFDWLAGSNFSAEDEACENRQMAIERVLSKHLKRSDLSRMPVRTIENMYDTLNVNPRYFQEYYNWQERRSKFMSNSMRGYEFHGLEFRLPFWDREIVDFCMATPPNYRLGRNIFLEAERHGILVDQLLSVPYANKVDMAGRNAFIDTIKKLLSGPMKTLILRLTGRKIKMNEGLNRIYALKASTVGEILSPVEDFPEQTRIYFDMFLDRFPYQVDYHFLTTLYTIRRQLNRLEKDTP